MTAIENLRATTTVFFPGRFRMMTFLDRHTEGGLGNLREIACEECCKNIAPGEQAAVVIHESVNTLVHERCVGKLKNCEAAEARSALNFLADLMCCKLRSENGSVPSEARRPRDVRPSTRIRRKPR